MWKVDRNDGAHAHLLSLYFVSRYSPREGEDRRSTRCVDAIHSVQLRSAVACEDVIDASLAALREHLDIDAVSTPEMDEVGVAAALGNAKSLARDAIAALHSRSVVRV